MLFFRVRDNSILPSRLPTCTGSNGFEEDTGSVNWGWGSHIILGFQLGESFGSVSYKIKEPFLKLRLMHTTLLAVIQFSKTRCTDRWSWWWFTSSSRRVWKFIPKYGDAFHLQVFMCKCGWLMHIHTRTLLARFITVNNPESNDRTRLTWYLHIRDIFPVFRCSPFNNKSLNHFIIM